jgi:hypothetical protein
MNLKCVMLSLKFSGNASSFIEVFYVLEILALHGSVNWKQAVIVCFGPSNQISPARPRE